MFSIKEHISIFSILRFWGQGQVEEVQEIIKSICLFGIPNGQIYVCVNILCAGMAKQTEGAYE